MKVLHLNEHLALKGGVETYLLGALPLLAKRGVDSTVAYAHGDPLLHADSLQVPLLADATADPAQVHAAVTDVLRAEQPDLIHVHNVQSVGVWQACVDYGPTVLTTHDFRTICPANMFFQKRTRTVCQRDGAGLGCIPTTLVRHCLTPRPQYAHAFYRRARWGRANGHRFAGVIAPSGRARERLIAGGFPADRITVLPYFCPVPPAQTPRPIPERPTITFLGRLAPNKGQEYFVEALSLLPESVQGTLVGNLGPDGGASIQQLATQRGCADRLTLQGWASRKEVAALLDRTTVFVFPSLWEETLGIVGLEALARGVPVVASALGGTAEWCLDGETGFRVPPKDAAAIADAVRRLTIDSATLQAFGRRGIDLIGSRFLPSLHVDRLLDLYRAAAATSVVGQ